MESGLYKIHQNKKKERELNADFLKEDMDTADMWCRSIYLEHQHGKRTTKQFQQQGGKEKMEKGFWRRRMIDILNS